MILHIMINHPIKYESYQTNELGGVGFKIEAGGMNEETNQ